ncbi:MAG TPA: hypothetical protein VHI13_06845 [Candidatus Kapabacteria bacterium]|nr:hypothetical protein [Candidatus Kapabacteria bacterium]
MEQPLHGRGEIHPQLTIAIHRVLSGCMAMRERDHDTPEVRTTRLRDAMESDGMARIDCV